MIVNIAAIYLAVFMASVGFIFGEAHGAAIGLAISTGITITNFIKDAIE